jgi:5-methylthioadenosine/S-adenosylhomocysteine deaminase
MTAIVHCERAIVAGEGRRDFGFAVENARIAAAGDLAALTLRFPQAPVRRHDGNELVVPGFVNGHSHAYQILLRGWADDRAFQRWRSEALYQVVPRLLPEDVYWTFRHAFREMLAAGITSVVEFFYLNGEGNERAEAAIRAARDSGIRLVLARAWMDAPSVPAAFRENTATAAARTVSLMRAFPEIDVCIAPHSLHAASPEMVTAASQFAVEFGCMMHVHVAEAEYEGAQTLERYGATPVALLDRLGALNERTVAVHAIHLNEDEKDLIVRRRARVVHNPMTNQYLGDGICDVAGLHERGVPIALGTDADVKPSVIDEMRAACMLQKLARLDASALSAQTAFALGTAAGAAALGIDAGDLREGAHADYVVLDASPIDSWTPDVNAVVYRAQDAWVKETYVGGELVHRREDGADADVRGAVEALAARLSLPKAL